MKRKIAAVLLLGAIIGSAMAGCTSGGNTSSAVSSETSSTAVSSETSSAASSEASSEASSAVSSETSPAVSSESSSAGSSQASSTSSKVDPKTLYREKEESFTFKDGVYRRVYGNRAIFVVTKDVSGMSEKERSALAETTAGDFYKNKYYCTVAFVKPDKDDGTFDMTVTKTDDRIATVYDMHRPDSSSITINLKEHPLQEYIDKQIKKAKVKE